MRVSISTVCLAVILIAGVARAATFTGTCDASAAVAVGPHRFLLAADEDNILRLYDADHPEEKPELFTELIPFLAPDTEPDDVKEADIEGAARLGNRVFWVTSHGRNDEGEQKAMRHQLFATEVVMAGDGVTIRPLGKPYINLVAALLDDKRLEPLLRTAAQPAVEKDAELAPKKGGLNIEGLSAGADGKSLLIGLRNPLAHTAPTGAIAVPLLNPNEVVNSGAPPVFGAPIVLDLTAGGEQLGIRSMDLVRERGADVYYIVGGTRDERENFALFRWSGVGSEKPKLVAAFNDFKPEAVFADPATEGRLILLSDDGKVSMPAASASECKKKKFAEGHCECKDLKDSARQRFRSIAIEP